MNIRKIASGLMMALLMTGNVYAIPGKGIGPQNNANNGNHYAYGHYKIKMKGGGQQGGAGRPYLVPEIDAKSGTSAIGLLVGILLLASERSRSKRQPKEASTVDSTTD